MAALTIGHVHEQISGAVYIGLGTSHADPVTSEWSRLASVGQLKDRSDLVWRYHHLLLGDGARRAALVELRSETVVCWCRRSDERRTPNNLCHADVMSVWLDYFSDRTLRWLGEHELATGWVDELDHRIAALLIDPDPGILG